MKILVDTNIFLDILLQRKPLFKDSQRVFKLVENQLAEGFIAPITINNIVYIARKSHQQDRIKNFITAMSDTFEICQMNSDIVRQAIKLHFSDFEDALQASMAAAHHCNVIITSNISDYQHSPVPAIAANEFLSQFQFS